MGKILGKGKFGIVHLGDVWVDALPKRKTLPKRLSDMDGKREISVAVKMMKGLRIFLNLVVLDNNNFKIYKYY